MCRMDICKIIRYNGCFWWVFSSVCYIDFFEGMWYTSPGACHQFLQPINVALVTEAAGQRLAADVDVSFLYGWLYH